MKPHARYSFVKRCNKFFGYKLNTSSSSSIFRARDNLFNTEIWAIAADTKNLYSTQVDLFGNFKVKLAPHTSCEFWDRVTQMRRTTPRRLTFRKDSHTVIKIINCFGANCQHNARLLNATVHETAISALVRLEKKKKKKRFYDRSAAVTTDEDRLQSKVSPRHT